MSLNTILEKVIKEKKDNPNKDVNVNVLQLFVSLGTRVILIYVFCIFLIGKYIAKLFSYNNLYFFSIFIGTVINILIIQKIIKTYKIKKNNY